MWWGFDAIVSRADPSLAGIPRTPASALAPGGFFFSMLDITALLGGLSLKFFTGLFVRELAHGVKGWDTAPAGAPAYWAGGVVGDGRRSSAGDVDATKSRLRPASRCCHHQRA